MATVSNGNGSAFNNEPSLDLQVCALNEKIIALITEEESLRELKNETAKEYRTKIAEAKDARMKLVVELKALNQTNLEVIGTTLIEASATVAAKN